MDTAKKNTEYLNKHKLFILKISIFSYYVQESMNPFRRFIWVEIL